MIINDELFISLKNYILFNLLKVNFTITKIIDQNNLYYFNSIKLSLFFIYTNKNKQE